jgi:hypothetical protein
MAITLSGFSQDAWRGFWKPVNNDMFIAKLGQRAPSSVVKVRPVVSITAMCFNLKKPSTVSSLNSLGTGVSVSHFIDVNGEPYMNYAFNFLALFGTEIADIAPLELSLAATVSAFQYINVGVGYNFADKCPFLMTGVQFNFNK